MTEASIIKGKSERVLIWIIIFSMVIWGTTWSVAKVAGAYGSSQVVACIRFTITAIAMGVVLPLFGISLKLNRKGFLYVFSASVLMILYALCFFHGLKEGHAGAAGVLVTTMNPIFAYAVGLVVSKRYPNKRESVGLVVGLIAGCILLHIWSGYSFLLDAGNLFFILGAFIWAVMGKISSHAHKFGHALGFSFWLNVICAVGMFLISDKNELVTVMTTADGLFWENILYFGVVNSGFATSVYLLATTRIGPERTSSFIFIVPTSAMLTSWAFLGEAIQLHTVIGGVVGILAVFIINKKVPKVHNNIIASDK